MEESTKLKDSKYKKVEKQGEEAASELQLPPVSSFCVLHTEKGGKSIGRGGGLNQERTLAGIAAEPIPATNKLLKSKSVIILSF
ncbi:hypothetical protein JCGZ_10767 [Jatropha curcas]|uniref:Uncharacterized protein n=1 Tax=Jatropha curcas TaxID=180498 RepID=A0A067LQ32_JATCU|nr:hypothetical protein JCGZ_10767 [Jatropha curcas]